jgi:hypothetical protein
MARRATTYSGPQLPDPRAVAGLTLRRIEKGLPVGEIPQKRKGA